MDLPQFARCLAAVGRIFANFGPGGQLAAIVADRQRDIAQHHRQRSDRPLVAEGGHDVVIDDPAVVAEFPLRQTAVRRAGVKRLARSVHRQGGDRAGKAFFDRQLLGDRFRLVEQAGIGTCLILPEHGEAIVRQTA